MRWLRVLLPCVLFGVVLGALAAEAGIDSPLVAGLLVLAVGYPAYFLYLRYRLPARCRAVLAQQLDPSAGPPPDTEPLSLPVAERWAAALASRDWTAAAGLLSDDFAATMTTGGRERRLGRRGYIRNSRILARAFRDVDIAVGDTRAERASPDIAWVSFSERLVPHRGRSLEVAWWERWDLDPARERIRRSTIAGVTRLA